MTTAGTASLYKGSESESGADQQCASAEIMSLDELTSELANVNRRFEALAFQFKYNKAEHNHIVELKNEKIKQLELELEQKTMSAPEMKNDIEILTSRVYYLKKTLTTLEEENRTLISTSKHKDEEIVKMREKMEKLQHELYITQERFCAKTEEVRLHKGDNDRLERDNDRLERKLDETNRLMAENNRFLAENAKQMKVKEMQEQRDRSEKREMRHMQKRILKKLDEVLEVRDTSSQKAGQIQEINVNVSNVSGPGNSDTSRSRPHMKLPVLSLADRATPENR